jgi:hypothetical protein
MVQKVANKMTARSTPNNVPRLLWAVIAILVLGAAAAIAVVTQPVVPADPNGETVSREAADSSPAFRASLDEIALSRAHAAEAARLQGLADSFGVPLTRSQIAEAARLQGLAEWFGVNDGY